MRRQLYPAPDQGNGDDWLGAIERLRGAYANSTLEMCAIQFDILCRWCAEMGHDPCALTPEACADFVAWSFESVAQRTILTRLYAIRHVYRGLGKADPTVTEPVQLAMRRGKRLYGAPPRQAMPIDAALRDRLRDACPGTPLGLRDRALLALGYDTLCRRNELTQLRIEDLRALPDGTAEILVRREKQHPVESGGMGFLSVRGHTDVRTWLELAGYSDGPILRRVNGPKIFPAGLKNRNLGERIKVMARAANLPPEIVARLSTHSLRVGAVQDLTRSGKSLLQIMRAGRWRHVDVVAAYARATPVNVWAQDEGDTYPIAARLDSWRRRTHPKARRVPTG